jgi:hypothetical protein
LGDVGLDEVSGSGSDGDYGVIDPEPEGDYKVPDPGFDGDHEVIDSGSGGDYEISDPDGGDEVVDPKGDGEIVTLVPDGDYEVTDTGLDRDYRILTLAGDGGNSLPAVWTFGEAAATVGLSEQAGDWAGLPINAGVDWSSMPEIAQVRSGVGLDMAAQMAACSDVISNLPDVAGRFNHEISQISASAAEAFGAIQIEGIANLPANQ